MLPNDILQQLKEAYVSAIPGHLEEMESCILAMEEGKEYKDNFEALYRKAHSLKGSGGTYGFAIITSICHQMEDFISEALENQSSVPPQAFNNIFKYIDLLKDTQSLLLNSNDNFNDIEAELKHLKGDSLTHEINGILVGPNNMYSQICMQAFAQTNAHCTTIESGVAALQRLTHEHFDFIVTSKENVDLSGPALIAALKLNQRKDSKLKTILTTSNPSFRTCEEVKPDFIVLKDKEFSTSLLNTIEKIKKSR